MKLTYSQGKDFASVPAPGQFLWGRLLPDPDDHDGEHDQDKPHDGDGEDQHGGHQRSAPY
jgi:hypothetical protein